VAAWRGAAWLVRSQKLHLQSAPLAGHGLSSDRSVLLAGGAGVAGQPATRCFVLTDCQKEY
jgi:hypothetical protein